MHSIMYHSRLTRDGYTRTTCDLSSLGGDLTCSLSLSLKRVYYYIPRDKS